MAINGEHILERDQWFHDEANSVLKIGDGKTQVKELPNFYPITSPTPPEDDNMYGVMNSGYARVLQDTAEEEA